MFNSNRHEIESALERAAAYRALGADKAADTAEETATKLSALEQFKQDMLAKRVANNDEDEIIRKLAGR